MNNSNPIWSKPAERPADRPHHDERIVVTYEITVSVDAAAARGARNTPGSIERASLWDDLAHDACVAMRDLAVDAFEFDGLDPRAEVRGPLKARTRWEQPSRSGVDDAF